VGRQPGGGRGHHQGCGGTYLTGRKEKDPNVYYEVKYRTPESIVFDITETGWKGAVKDVMPKVD
jgi:lactoylglutathione lyase